MKLTASTVLPISALISGTSASISTSTTYSLRVSDSQNNAIANSTLSLKDDPTANTSPNALGVWSSGEPRDVYTFTFSTSPNDTRLYELKGSVRQTQLTLFGNKVAMQFLDVPIGVVLQPEASEARYNDKWTVLEMNSRMFLRHGQDWNSSETPMGGAGSWRACKSSNGIDYPMYWYDGSSPLPYLDCEGIQLELVEAHTATDTATGTGMGTGPSATGNASSTSTAKPSPSSFEGAASRIGTVGALLGIAITAAVFVL
jgi:hypothetical protein